jgi:hypothetical protein
MPELAAGGLHDAGQLIQPAIDYVSEALALVCSLAPATEVALTATVLRDLLDQLGRLGLDFAIMRDHGDERYADGVEDGIEIGRAQVLAEQAAAVESRRASFHVVRQQRPSGGFPVLPHAGSA